METSGKSNTMMVTDGRILGAPEGVTAPSRKTQTGRGRQCKATVIRTSGQGVVAPNSVSQRKSRDYAVAPLPAGAARKTVNAGESRAFEITSDEYKPTDELKAAVRTSIGLLKKEKKKHGEKSLLFCLAVTKELDHLINKFKIDKDESEEYKFVASHLGPQYGCSLRPALETLKSRAAEKRSWEHYKDLVSVMKYLDLPQDKPAEKVSDKELTRGLCEQFLHNEICYLEHVKDFPVAAVANESFMIVEYLVKFLSANSHCDFMSEDELRNIRRNKNRLMDIIKSNSNKDSVDEYIQKAEQDLINQPADIQDKRRYNDLLRVRLAEINKRNEEKDVRSIQEHFLMLKEVCILRKKCVDFTSEFHVVLYDITALISGIAKQMLKQGMDHCVQFEKEWLDFIGGLMLENLLSDECGRLYLHCRETQVAARTVVRTNRIAGDQCTKQLDEIDSLVKTGTEDCAIKAACMLRELLFEYGYEIKNPDTGDLQLTQRIEDIEDILFTQLFKPVTDKFEKYKTIDKDDFETDEWRQRLMQLTPYAFVIRNKEHVIKWQKTVCSAWNSPLKRIGREESFTENDIDCLLDLKCAAPDVPSPCTRTLLERTCEHLFQVILENTDHDEKIPVKKLEMLHQWINEIATLKKINKRHQSQHEAKLTEINWAWKRKYKDTAAGVAFNQPVSDAVLIRPEPEELSPPENKSSPAPLTKAPVVIISGPSSICHELRAGFEKGMFFTAGSSEAGFSETPKQPASVTTGMVTAQVSQSAPLSLQDADQPLFKTDEPVPQSTVADPAEMMTAGDKVDIKAKNRSIQETQEGMPSPEKAKTQTERVSHKAEAIQIPSQMAAASSSTSRQTDSDDCAMAVAEPMIYEASWKAMDVEEACTFRIVECEYQPTEIFRLDIEASLKTLEKKEKKYGATTLSFCRAVVIEFDRLKNKFRMNTETESDNYKFMKCQLAPHYVNSLRPALDTLKAEADEQRVWRHHQDFLSLMRYFDLQTDEDSIKDNQELSQEIYLKSLTNELSYQDYINNIPFAGITSNSDMVMQRLLQDQQKGTLHKGGSLLTMSRSDQERIENKMKDMKFHRVTSAQSKHNSIDEYIEKLEKKIRAKDARVLDKRLYGDLLKIQVKRLTTNQKTNQKKSKNKGSCEHFLLLKKACELHDKCFLCLDESALALGNVKMLISSLVKSILQEGMDNVVPLKQKVLDFIGQLMANDILGNECKWIYLACKESQARMKTATPMGKITNSQCEKEISEIGLLLEKKDRAELLKAAKMLRKLLHNHYDEITRLSKADLHLSAIKRIKNMLCDELFQPVLDEFDKGKAIAHNKEYNEEYNKNMDGYRSVFVELYPYTFVVSNQKRFDWVRAACAAWYCTLDRMFHAESFRADDVDCLLDLKCIAPGMPNPHIRILLGKVLEKLLAAMLDEPTCDIPDEKLATISQWIEDLVHIRGINKQQQEHDDEKLKELNEAWKRKSKGTTISVTSDRPVPDAALLRPESGEPSTSESKSPSTPTTEASVATVSRAGSIFPESRAGIERGKSLATDFSGSASKSVTLKRKLATDRVSSDQSVLDTTLSQFVSKKALIHEKSKSSLVVFAKKRQKQRPQKQALFPLESRTETERDKFPGADFSRAAEQTRFRHHRCDNGNNTDITSLAGR